MVTTRPLWASRTRRISNSRGDRSIRLPLTVTSWIDASKTSGPIDHLALPVSAGTCRAPERDPDASVQLIDAERLGDVVVGAAFERLDLLALVVATGQDQDGGRRLSPDSADDLDAVHVGQAEIEQDDVGTPRSQRCRADLPSIASSTR